MNVYIQVKGGNTLGELEYLSGTSFTVPRAGEYVIIEEHQYRVVNVLHNYDENVILVVVQ